MGTGVLFRAGMRRVPAQGEPQGGGGGKRLLPRYANTAGDRCRCSHDTALASATSNENDKNGNNGNDAVNNIAGNICFWMLRVDPTNQNFNKYYVRGHRGRHSLGPNVLLGGRP